MAAFSTIAAVGAGVASTAAGVASASAQGSAARRATDAQVQANRESIAFQREQLDRAEKLFQQNREDLEPFRESQLLALQKLVENADPNSEFANTERQVATSAIQRQLASQGLLRSKRQVDLLSNLETGLNRNRLATLGGIAGNNATQSIAASRAQQAGLATGVGQNIGNTLSASGNATAQGILNSANATTNALATINSGVQGTLGNIVTANQNESLLKQLEALRKSLGG